MKAHVLGTPLVSVVVATYNGARFLRAQLDSILRQSVEDLEIVVCDDCSTDDTPEILKAYSSDPRVRWSSNPTRLGAAKNFSLASSAAKGKYVAFSDQDDIWLPNKLECSISSMHALEEKLAPGTPAMVYTDVRIVGSDEHVISPSYYGYFHRNPRANRVNRTLCQGVALGCTILANRALVELATPVPDAATMHDSWFGLVGSAFGKLEYLDVATLLYRQHGANTSGVHKVTLFEKLRRAMLGMTDNKRYRANFYRRCREAEALLERFDGSMDADLQAVVSAFCRLPQNGPLKRRVILARYGFLKNGLLDNVEMFVRI